LIFGGFVEGSRTNECYIGKKSLGSIEWKRVGDNSVDKPSIRASQSAVCHNGKCYIFGGMSDDNIKMNDLWEFDLASENYAQIKLSDVSFQPLPRSGHTASIHNGKMIIFGGILELTKELNEMLLYDFGSRSFSIIGESHNEDLNALQQSNNRGREDDASPLQRKGTLKKSQI
jgi:N-acetylneuraminic acid mutarotase